MKNEPQKKLILQRDVCGMNGESTMGGQEDGDESDRTTLLTVYSPLLTPGV